MKKWLFALLCSVLLFLPACAGSPSGTETAPSGAYKIYYAVTDQERGGAAVDYVYYTPQSDVRIIPVLMKQLLTKPAAAGLKSPFPDGVRLMAWHLQDGQVWVNLSEQYSGLSGVELTLADYCIALTLCQITGVESVYITVEGEEIPFRHTQYMSANDVILSSAEEESVHIGVNLWFPRAHWSGLGVEYRQIIKDEAETLREAVLNAWLAGPEYASLTSYVPEGTQLLSADLEEGICYVNLSEEFLTGKPTDRNASKLLVYSLVNTIGSLDSVEGIQLLIEGEPVLLYGGINTGNPLTPDLTLEKN